MEKIRTAECSCGQVSLVCRGEPIRTAICHCFECQKRTGSVFGVQARFLEHQVHHDGEVASFSRISDSGGNVTYSFCPRCGTTMLLHLENAPEFIVIPIGVFKQQDLPTPSFSIYEKRQFGWVSFDCQMKHYD